MAKANRKQIRRGWALWIIDLLILVIAFLFIAKLKPATVRIYLPRYSDPFYIFLVIWSIISFVTGKYFLIRKLRRKDYLVMILLSNAVITGIVSFAIYFLGYYNFSRLIVYGTIGMATLMELFFAAIFTYYLKLNRKGFYYEGEPEGRLLEPLKSRKERKRLKEEAEAKEIDEDSELDQTLIEASSQEVHDFIVKYVDLNSPKTVLFSTTTLFNIQKLKRNNAEAIINLKRINDVRHLNTFFKTVNERLIEGGTYILNAETAEERRKRLIAKYPPVINYIYLSLDYLLKRVAPKIKATRWLYFMITRGNNRVLTHVEILGRLYYSGFELIREKEIEGRSYLIMNKKGAPKNNSNPSYGPLIRLRRQGKDGKTIGVYKFRTMYPYSEFLQEYIFNLNNLQEGGKIKDDFRVSPMGKFLRKVWLDEFPMILNLLKGQLKIVGVRPLSAHYFSLYSDELKEKRTTVKPGLIPPFYADLPHTLEEIQQSELRYIESYQKSPLKTDWSYFWKAVGNIVLNRARSA
ncbi:sugar transferase [Saccharicrinis sp. FJH2]|uniref:sugar transferase n=1 Tax=Saccharicrinis sp. FJH65 TaxID=3344659 RepID=UPI0035F22674